MIRRIVSRHSGSLVCGAKGIIHFKNSDMTTETICQGEDFSLLLHALSDDSDTSEDVSEYDFEMLLYTSAMGCRVLASTKEGGELPIVRRDNSTLFVNIPGEVTASFLAGPLKLEVMKVDQQGTREIAQKIILQVLESKLGRL